MWELRPFNGLLTSLQGDRSPGPESVSEAGRAVCPLYGPAEARHGLNSWMIERSTPRAREEAWRNSNLLAGYCDN